MNLQKILINYKTSSAGFLLIIGAVVGIIFSVLDNGRVEKDEIMIAFTAIFGGISALLARDIGVSTEAENGVPELEDAGERTDATK
jgi:hypothetical protein